MFLADFSVPHRLRRQARPPRRPPDRRPRARPGCSSRRPGQPARRHQPRPSARARQQVTVAEAKLRDAHREPIPDLKLQAGEWYSWRTDRKRAHYAARLDGLRHRQRRPPPLESQPGQHRRRHRRAGPSPASPSPAPSSSSSNAPSPSPSSTSPPGSRPTATAPSSFPAPGAPTSSTS